MKEEKIFKEIIENCKNIKDCKECKYHKNGRCAFIMVPMDWKIEEITERGKND